MNTGNWLNNNNNNNSADSLISKDFEGYSPYKFKPPADTDRNWSMEPNIVKPYSTIKHTGGLILSGIILFVLFEIFSAISYLIDLLKQ
jgi:hypothetical protein